MIEKIILDWLNGQYQLGNLSAKVYMEKPDNPPGRYVLLEKTAGGEANHIASAVVALQSYAPTLYQAAQLNEEVKACMKAMTQLPEISRCSLNTDYNYSDPEKKKYRYQAVFNLVYFN